ncbi:MAG: peptidase [Magnetococcales bacterium]|nr:peptidase [Magnetococcales bacterium]
MNTPQKIAIFKTGRHTDMGGTSLDFREGDLQASAAAYDPNLHEAPLVIGHPRHDAPAHGWVAQLETDGDLLSAITRQVDPGFARTVADGRFKKVSASFYTPTSPNNPRPGVYYLRHVGFLGAQPPSVKGLPEASFKENEEGVVVLDIPETAFSEPTTHTENDMAQDHDNLTARIAELKQREEKLVAWEAAFAEREKELQEAEAEAQADKINAFVTQLVDEGLILPRQMEGLVAFLISLDESGDLMFSEEGEEVRTNPLEYIQSFLKNLPAQVDFSERAAEGSTDLTHTPFRVPEGYSVDPAGLKTHMKAMAYAREKNIDYATAVTELSR